MSHTPGPWTLCKKGDYSDFDGDSQVILSDIRHLPIRIAAIHVCDKKGKANAQLISAAPELLEVAKALAKWDFRNNREHFKALANAAIAKAEGK